MFIPSEWVAPIIDGAIQVFPYLFRRKKLKGLVTLREELESGQPFCQKLIRLSDGLVIVPDSVTFALLRSPVKREAIPLMLRKARQEAEAKHAELIALPGAKAVQDKVIEIVFLTFYHRLLSEVEDHFANQWFLNRSIRQVIQARERYEELESTLRDNVRAQILAARNHAGNPLALPNLPQRLKAGYQNNVSLEHLLQLSHQQTLVWIYQLVQLEKNRQMPERVFVELMICKRRDWFLSQVEDALMTRAC